MLFPLLTQKCKSTSHLGLRPTNYIVLHLETLAWSLLETAYILFLKKAPGPAINCEKHNSESKKALKLSSEEWDATLVVVSGLGLHQDMKWIKIPQSNQWDAEQNPDKPRIEAAASLSWAMFENAISTISLNYFSKGCVIHLQDKF